MHAVTRAGGVPKARTQPILMGWVLASGILTAQAQEATSHDKKAAVDQLEQLMREQQSLQTRQTQQLQSIRQQLDAQERMNAVQDWQWAGSLALLLLLAAAGFWLAQRWPTLTPSAWPNPWARWQQARRDRRQERQARREQAATEHIMRFKPSLEEDAQNTAEPTGSGGEIDHSGPGALGHLLRQTKLRRALKKTRREEQARKKELLDAPLSEMPAGQGWMAVLDEPDSQLLADEAMREFELRRAVGLQPEPELPPASAKAAQRQHAIDTESAWQAMQEVSLSEPTPAPAVSNTGVGAGVGATVEAGVDVSLEVQRVRSGLRARRERRNLTMLSVVDAADSAGAAPSGRTDLECDIPLSVSEAAQAVVAAPMPEQVAEPISEPIAVSALLAVTSQPVQMADATHALDVAATPQVQAATSSSTSPHASDASFSLSSLPAHTEAETRLALGYEFQKLGQYDEAAQLYEEVLAMGSILDQERAQQLLSALPGR